MKDPTILLSAGEPSGDLHGAQVARALRRRWPDARLWGLGGPRMAAEGVELLAGLDRLAVMGFVEVLRHLPYFSRLRRLLRRRLRADPPDLVLPIDYPGFNLRLAADAHAERIPVLYYIAPQVWAWRRGRAQALARNADALAVVLPFEEELFRQVGARVEFVGHPLLSEAHAEVPREEFCVELGLDPARPILALFPGSRPQEVARHLAAFTGAAELLCLRRSDLQPVVAAGGAVPAEAYAACPYPRTADAWSLLRCARGGVVKSGTSTLQAALAGMPMVIAYRTHPLTYQVARNVVRVDHVGLANLVAGRRVAPELLQDAATPEALAAALEPLLEEGPARAESLTALATIRAALTPGGPGGGPARDAAERVAELAAQLMVVGAAGRGARPSTGRRGDTP